MKKGIAIQLAMPFFCGFELSIEFLKQFGVKV